MIQQIGFGCGDWNDVFAHGIFKTPNINKGFKGVPW
jgi:hypothetical protein